MQFTAFARTLDEKTLPKLTSFASVDELKSVIPDELLANESLLPFAGNLFVVGMANANGDVVSKEDALKYYKLFKHTRVDLEHKFQDHTLGHIVEVGFSKFNPNFASGEGSELLSEEEAAALEEPFNCWVCGVIYKTNAPEIVEKFLDSCDKTSDGYLSVSLSWEIAFEDSDILLGNSTFNGKVISSADKKVKYLPYLKSSSGSGFLSDGTPVNRLIMGSWIPLGAGCTLNPAASVKGIVVPDKVLEDEKEEVENENSTESSATEPSKEEIILVDNEKTEKIISHSENVPVNLSTKDNSIIKPMKYIDSFASLQTLTQEELSQVSVANISDIIQKELRAELEKHQKAVAEKENEIKSAQTKASEAEKVAAASLAQIKELSEKIEALETAQANAEAEALFQSRMSAFDEVYDLNDADRQIIAKRIKGLDNDAFEAEKADFDVLFAAKKKGAKGKDKGMKSDCSTKNVVASALANANVQAPTIPNSTPSDTSDLTKFEAAFASVVK